MDKVRLCLAQFLSLLFRASEICDVNIGSDVAGKFSSAGVSRNATFHHPAVFPTRAPEPVLHAERPSRFEGRQEAIEAPLHVVRMHALNPSRAYLLFHRSAGEVEPGLIEIVAKAIRSGHPNQYRRRVGHRLEPGLAFAQVLLSALPLSDVAVYGIVCNLLTGTSNDRNG